MGHFVHKLGHETRVGAFIYTLSADESSPDASNAVFLPGATPTEHITYYTWLRKVVCQETSPFGTPVNEIGGMIPKRAAYRRLLSAVRFLVSAYSSLEIDLTTDARLFKQHQLNLNSIYMISTT